MPFQGYVRFPTIHQDSIVFVAEDDLWLVESAGGRAERLTAGVAEVQTPVFSPDGRQLAFVGKAEGTEEVYLMPGLGDETTRLTFHSAACTVTGWSPTGESILFASSAGQFHGRAQALYAISPRGGLPSPLPYGLANAITYGPQGGVVIGRNIGEPAHWKRYRGGTAGQLWCDLSGEGQFQRLVQLDGNLASPCWIGERIYFISDHEGIGNIYSCTPTGEDIRRHTAHSDFYARNLNSDGTRIVYHAGGDLYLFDPASEENRRVEITLPSTRTQRSRKFVSASLYLDTYTIHPLGYAVALTTRGKAFSMACWEGPVLQHGEPDGVRYRYLTWLNDGKRLVAVHDASGQEGLILFNPDEASEPRTFPDLDIGHVFSLEVSPTEDKVALTNHRQEVIVVDLEAGSARVIDKSIYWPIRGTAWAPDGKWLAYSFWLTAQKSAIKLCKLESGETFLATEPVFRDRAPAFDPEGKYLYFIGARVFHAVHDNLHFDLHFPNGEKPYAIMLRRDLRSPFIPEPKSPAEKEESAKKAQNELNSANGNKAGGREEDENKENNEAGEQGTSTDLIIDLEGITERAVPFPLAEGRYRKIAGLKGKVLIQSSPSDHAVSPAENHQPHGKIECFDFETHKVEWSIEGVSAFEISRDAKTLLYSKFRRLRVLKATEKPKDNSERASRESGWLDLERVKVSVQPAAEWRQMFAEAWRLQREYFWDENMSGVNWPAVYEQYAPLLERVGSRDELSDLFWEIQGELGTSHAYESAGDYRRHPYYRQGFLGVDWAYDAEHDRYRIAHIVKGDTSDPQATSPLTSPGLNIQEGDAVLAINGQRLGQGQPPQALLVNQANQEVQLVIEAAESQEIRTVTVKALSSERQARYRAWVESNRALVHTLSDGRLGYIHIPDMGNHGFAEFHRSYLVEYDAQGLVVDVRWNGGGSVSGLLLEKLARRRLAYRFSRWHQPQAYPYESPSGPMVALTNEHAGSDGDKFSHSFKLMGLGPLIGTRTWGGVIGISYSHPLVDGTHTTQPALANWFKDVGWNLENYGTDPDIEVDISPQDYVNKKDPQLERAVEECLKLIESYPFLKPEPGERPYRGRKV
jgi:tricorn protease